MNRLLLHSFICIIVLLLSICEVKSFHLLLPQQQQQMTTSSSISSFERILQRSCRNNMNPLYMSDKEWSKVLYENSGEYNDDQKKKSNNFLKGNQNNFDMNPKLIANTNLIQWLEVEGNVYLSELSTWGEAPHPLAISTDTVDEITNENSGRGLLARRDINDGDLLIQIPISLCFTKASARAAFGNEIIQSGMNEYLAIALQLIHEKFQLKDKSKYKSYMDILPDINEVNPTFTWSESDLIYLKGSPVIAASISLQNKLKREYESLLTNIDTGFIYKYPHIFNETIYTYENWIWSFTMLFSRAIRLRNIQDGEILAMVPYADLINHSPYSQSYIDAQQTGDWLFKTGTEEVVLYADRGYRRMEQIYISYGPKSNAELLLLYGFAVERNPYNSVDVTVSIQGNSNKINKDGSISLSDDPLADEKIAFLKSVGREQTVDFPCYADRYPIEMLEYLRLMQMTIDDTGGKALNEFDYTRAISPGNEAAVLYSIIQAIQNQLMKYPNNEEDDAAIIKDKQLFRTLNYNQRMAIRHRRNEKRLLKRTIAALEKQLQKQGITTKQDGLYDLDELEQQQRAQGNTLGAVLTNNDPNNNDMMTGTSPKYSTLKSSLEDRLEKMGLPVDLR